MTTVASVSVSNLGFQAIHLSVNSYALRAIDKDIDRIAGKESGCSGCGVGISAEL